MPYFFGKRIDADFDEVVRRARSALSAEGFGILTEIDVATTLKRKIGADFRPYLILGACNPRLAHQALQLEDKIGTMLPCNVIVQELDGGSVEVAAVDPVASMQAVGNERLANVACEVRKKLQAVIDLM